MVQVTLSEDGKPDQTLLVGAFRDLREASTALQGARLLRRSGIIIMDDAAELAEGDVFTWSPAHGRAPRLRKAYVLLEENTKDVFSFQDGPSSAVASRLFYLDPNHEASLRLLDWLDTLRLNHDELAPQAPLIITGPTKSGKSFTLNEFLPALIRTNSIVRRTRASSAGSQPDDELSTSGLTAVPLQRKQGKDTEPASGAQLDAAPELSNPNFFYLDCLVFNRTSGLRGFLQDLLKSMRRQAQALGLAAGSLPLPSAQLNEADMQQAILQLMEMQPPDNMNVFLLDEAQSSFLLLKQGASGMELDMQEVQESRRFFKHLTTMSPPHCVWAVTGSTMAILWASIVQTPTNGLALQSSMWRLALPAEVGFDVMATACQELEQRYSKAGYATPPAAVAASCLPHHAMLAYMYGQWCMPSSGISNADSFVVEMMEQKIFPAVLSDFRLVLDVFAKQPGVLSGLLNLLDPLKGCDENKLDSAFKALFRPYLKSMPDSDKVYMDSAMYLMLLQAVTTTGGKLQALPFTLGASTSTYSKLFLLQNIGAACVDARRQQYTQSPVLRGLLVSMAAVLGRSSNDLVSQRWFKQVLQHPCNQHRAASNARIERQAFDERMRRFWLATRSERRLWVGQHRGWRVRWAGGVEEPFLLCLCLQLSASLCSLSQPPCSSGRARDVIRQRGVLSPAGSA